MAYLIGLKNRSPIPKSEGQKQSESADYNWQSVEIWCATKKDMRKEGDIIVTM